MSEIIKNRTIRPSTRLESSTSYKVNTSRVTRHDTLIVNVHHEDGTEVGTYRFNGQDVADRNSIHFRVSETSSGLSITWGAVSPLA